MVMPARVADARVADVLCGEGAAGMQQVGVAPKQIQTQRRFGSKLSGPCFSPRDEEHGHKAPKAPF